MTDLRAACIEAGMEAFAEHDAKWEPPHYGIDELAEACLDAVLDVLADRADEWAQSSLVSDEAVADWTNSRSVEIVGRLIAVLRGDTQ